jgi:DNA-binding MurR/RpiR family transcriptional regulator
LEQTLWLRRNFPDMATAICALYLGVSESSVKRIAYAMGLQKTAQFMREAQAHAARRAKESHLRNGTYPPKGWYSPNLQKGQQYRFKPKEI